MELYNALSNSIKSLFPNHYNSIGMYSLEYKFQSNYTLADIRRFIAEDVLVKTLQFYGYRTEHHILIDDLHANLTNGDLSQREWKKIFSETLSKYNISKDSKIHFATDNVKCSIQVISKLVEKGYARNVQRNIYFRDKGSSNTDERLLLFKMSNFDDIKFVSPFGMGCPTKKALEIGVGLKHLGGHIDILCQNKKTHSQEYNSAELVTKSLQKPWYDIAFCLPEINISEENDVSSLIENENFNPLVLRFMFLTGHYRSNMSLKKSGIEECSHAYSRLLRKIYLIDIEGGFQECAFRDYVEKFLNFLRKDLNTANAITLLFILLKDRRVNGKTKLEIVKTFDRVLGLNLTNMRHDTRHPQSSEIDILVERRSKFRREHKFSEADAIRDELTLRGLELIDTKRGTIYKIKEEL